MLNGTRNRPWLIAAHEVEYAIDSHKAGSFRIAAQTPELYFCRDLKGYGWCFRKQDYLNIGVGRLDSRALPNASTEFVDFLKAKGKIPADASWQWRGHAYLVSGAPRRRAVGEAVILVGDAAGVADPHSGEGIRQAIESGLIAASTIVEADGRYARDRKSTRLNSSHIQKSRMPSSA